MLVTKQCSMVPDLIYHLSIIYLYLIKDFKSGKQEGTDIHNKQNNTQDQPEGIFLTSSCKANHSADPFYFIGYQR